MAKAQRVQRVSDLLQRELALILQNELTDPRLDFLTITEVDLSPDLKQAKVYVRCLSKSAEKLDVVAEHQHSQVHILQNSVGFIRHLLKDRAGHLRALPRLRFEYDKIGDQADRISQILQQSQHSQFDVVSE